MISQSYPNYIPIISRLRPYHRRKFRSETSDNMDSWKAEVRRVRRDKIRRKKMQMREKVGKSRNTVFFSIICGSGGSKSRLAKAAGAEPAGQMRDEKLHAVVARSTCPSQNVQNTPGSDHFWKLRCRKSARRCGAKHISKWTCTKHTMLGPLLEVQMSKKCTPLWRETHFQVKMCKTHHVRTTFGSWDVEKVHAVVARSTFRSQNVQSTPCTDHFWRFRCARDCGPCQKWAKREGFVAFSTTTTTTPHYTNTLHYNYNHTFTTFYYTTLHCTQLHLITLHYTTLHYTTLHYTTLHYTTLHYTTLHYATLHYITVHYTTFQYTTLHYTTLHYATFHNTTTTTTQNCTTVHYITLHYIPLHSTTLHYITLHYITLNDTGPQIDR